ncbi:MAG: hypothetical protein IAG10_18180, partial [Planctomycetaceae bacterium]|nr:hypothetical protein [Planctomycetaceae bacterium]
MPVKLSSFHVGSLYSNEEIFQSLEVGNAGGIRLKTNTDGGTRRMVVMTSLPNAKSLSENPYHDRIEGNVLVYTGAGRIGDQTIGGPNAKIAQQASGLFPMWGFQLQTSRRDRTTGPKRWRFLGLLQFLRSYAETQFDSIGKPRLAWLFELRVHHSPNEVAVKLDAEIMNALVRTQSVEERIEGNDREVELVGQPLEMSSSS